MPAIFSKFLLVLLAWTQRKILSVGRATWSDAVWSVEQVDAESARLDREAVELKNAAYKPMTPNDALAHAQDLLCESLQQRTGADVVPNIITRRLIQAAHIWVRLKAF